MKSGKLVDFFKRKKFGGGVSGTLREIDFQPPDYQGLSLWWVKSSGVRQSKIYKYIPGGEGVNHDQFLLSIVSYSFYLFVMFAEVLILKGKADAYK